MSGEIYVITNSPIRDLQEFVKNFKQYIDKCYSNKILLKDGTLLIFHNDKNIDGIRKYCLYHELFESFLKRMNEDLKRQLEEKQKIIDEIFNHDYCFPYECPLEAINNDDIQDIIERICNCDNCQDNHKKCWLKYFENEILARGKNENI